MMMMDIIAEGDSEEEYESPYDPSSSGPSDTSPESVRSEKIQFNRMNFLKINSSPQISIHPPTPCEASAPQCPTKGVTRRNAQCFMPQSVQVVPPEVKEERKKMSRPFSHPHPKKLSPNSLTEGYNSGTSQNWYDLLDKQKDINNKRMSCITFREASKMNYSTPEITSSPSAPVVGTTRRESVIIRSVSQSKERPGRFSLDHQNLKDTTKRIRKVSQGIFRGEKNIPSLWKQLRKTYSDSKNEDDVAHRRDSEMSHDEKKPYNNKLTRYEFAPDQVYLGECVDNKAHGNGIITHKNCKFGGLWENGYEVIGCYLWPNGVQYSGVWEQGYRHGEGCEKHRTYVYKGEWVRDVKEGYGVMLSIGGCKYEGTWHEGAQEGYGIEVYKDGSFYAGQFDEGMREGYGVRVMNPNARLKHTFTEDNSTESTVIESEAPSEIELEKHVGSQIFEPEVNVDTAPMMEVYRGYWKEDKRHGHGVEKNSRGDIYEGSFKDNVKHGDGVLHHNNGHVYHGKWKKNKLQTSKRLTNTTAQKSAAAARDSAQVAERKTWLALSRAEGARRIAVSATKFQMKAYEQYALADDKSEETLAQLNLTADSVISIANGTPVPKEGEKRASMLSPIAKSAKDIKSKLSDMAYLALSPKLARKSVSSIESVSSSPMSTPKSIKSNRSISLASPNGTASPNSPAFMAPFPATPKANSLTPLTIPSPHPNINIEAPSSPYLRPKMS